VENPVKFSGVLVCALLLSASVRLAAEKKPEPDPVVFGMLSGNSGCVIFAEGHKTSGHFYGVAVTSKTVGKLTVIETQNYTFADKEVLETQENLDNLMRTAQKDHIKFVKIVEKYSPALLEKARAVCKPDYAPS
jgi:hypothetical protein